MVFAKPGQDYSGRYGNYFCHALIIDKGCWDFYPIQLRGASVFKHQLTNVNQTPEPLPALSIDDLHINQDINFETVAAFLCCFGNGATRISRNN